MAGAGEALVLLTKYNAAIPGLGARPGLDAGWLERRLGLFDTWTLPSVRLQTRRPDAWLVFVDAETDPGHLRRLRDRLDGLGEVVPVEGALTDPRIGELVGARVAPGRRLLTARLDNDDAIAVDYLARVEAAAAGWRGFVNAPRGYRIRGERVVRSREPAGPFLAFAETVATGRPATVFQVPHSFAARRAPVRQLPGGPAWVQVVHGGNLANAFAGWPARGAEMIEATGLGFLRGRKLDGRFGARAAAAAVAGQLRAELGHLGRRLRAMGGAS